MSTTIFLATLLGSALGLLLDGAMGAVTLGVIFYLLLRMEALHRRVRALEQAHPESGDTTHDPTP